MISFLASFLAGLLGAFTPCAAVLIPVVSYKYLRDQKNYKGLTIFLVGFAFTYIMSAKFLSELFESTIKNGFQLGLGMLFVVLGVLETMKKLNPLNFPLIKNNFVFGAIFAFLMSFNPCTFAYLGTLISLSGSALFGNLLFFSFGLIIPSLLFVVFGQNLINITKKPKKVLNVINGLMGFVLIVSGIYLMLSVKSLGVYDVYVVGVLLGIVFLVLLRAYFVINSKKDFLRLNNIILILTLILIIFSVIYHCKSIGISQNIEAISCTNEIYSCESCLNCIYLFSGAVFLGFIAIFGNYLSKKDKD